jgi:tetratricopeptide (TPR) repeat protein
MSEIRKISIASALVGGIFVAVASVSFGQDLKEAAALEKRVTELYEAGKYEEAIPLAQRVLKLREKALGSRHPDLAESLNDLALIYAAQGRYVEAEPLHKRALAIQEKALGPDHPNLATTLKYLGVLYQNQARHACVAAQRSAYPLVQNDSGLGHPDPAVSWLRGSGEEPMLDLRRRQFNNAARRRSSRGGRSRRAQQGDLNPANGGGG